MSFLDELGLKAAEQLEASVGAYVALASYRRLFAAPPELRGRAVFGALRCAVELGDEREVRELVGLWSRETGTGPLPPTPGEARPRTAAALVGRLLASKRRSLAVELAQAEAERRPSAHALYVHARAREEASGPDLELWSAVVSRAHQEAHGAILTRAVARWLELVLWSPSAPRLSRPLREEIVLRAMLPDLALATPQERLVILRARLLGASRFARASALSGLEELGRTGPPSVRSEAIVACARHADVADGRLDPIEVDRVRAALKHWPVEQERERALARLDAAVALHALERRQGVDAAELERTLAQVVASAPETAPLVNRARAIAGGGTGLGRDPSSAGSGAARLPALGLDAVAALEGGQERDAELALTKAADALGPMAAIPGPLWAGARWGLRAKSSDTRRAAAAFVEQALLRSASAPPCGLSVLATELARAGHPAIATLALKEAVRLKEPGAARSLAEAQRALAYGALARGDRRRALECLREAKALFASAPPER